MPGRQLRVEGAVALASVVRDGDKVTGSGDGYEMILGILERAVYRNKEYGDIQGEEKEIKQTNETGLQ